MHTTDKEFLNKFKLLFSSLFARSMTKVIVGCQEFKRNEFLFTNIKLDEIQMYEPDPDYFIHKVEIFDTNFMDDLFERFPFFKEAICILYTDKILSTINKHVGSLEEIKTVFINNHYDVIVKTSEHTPLAVTCADLISPYDATQYVTLFQQSLVDPVLSKEKDISSDIDPNKDYSVVAFDILQDRHAKFVYATKSYVSLKEYPAKSKITEYSYVARASADKKTIRVNTVFQNEWLRVTSVQPSMIWITTSKQKDKKDE